MSSTLCRYGIFNPKNRRIQRVHRFRSVKFTHLLRSIAVLWIADYSEQTWFNLVKVIRPVTKEYLEH